MNLDEIMVKNGSDKASAFTRTYAKPKDYCRHYDHLFSAFREKPIKMLEIGVGGGESIRGWLDYFPNAEVVGVDIVHNTNPWDTPNSSPNPRYKFCQGDQSHDVFWACFINTYGKDWHVVVDDGSHCNDGIITSFNALWPHVKPGGFYAIEDLGVCVPGSMFVKPGSQTHFEFLFTQLTSLVMLSGSGIDSIYFSKELAVLRKAL